MRYEVRMSEEALTNIDETAEYIRFNYRNPVAAERFVDSVSEVAYSLAEFPGRIRLNAPDLGNPRGLRYVTVNNHSIIFQILENETVWIDAIWHKSRDISTKLRMIEESELFVDSYDKLTSNEVNFEKVLHELGTKENKTKYEKGQERELKLLEHQSQKTTKKQTRKH